MIDSLPLYTLLMILVLSGPLLISLWPKLRFWKNWQCLLAVFGLVSLPFILWDIWMTYQGAWGFSKELAGNKILLLPVGEWLFFIVIPFACLVMYEMLRYIDHKKSKIQAQSQNKIKFQIKNRKIMIGKQVLYTGTLVCLVFFLLNLDQIYTATVCLALAITLIFVANINHMLILERTFWLYMLLSFAGFLVINSLLTSLPIVWYNSSATLNWRVGSIPVEDFLYNASLLIISLLVWQKFKVKFI